MRKEILALLFVITGFLGFSQDVLIKQDDQQIVGKVLEIHSNEIHYKKYNNLEGPTYVIDNSSLKKILFENGDVETFDSQPQTQIIQNQYNKSTQTEAVDTREKIIESGGKFYYDGRRMSNRTLGQLIANSGDTKAIEMYDKSKTTQSIAYIAGYSSIVAGLVLQVGLLSFDPTIATVATLGGFFGFHLLQVVNHVGRSKYRNERKEAARLYNESTTINEQHDSGDYY